MNNYSALRRDKTKYCKFHKYFSHDSMRLSQVEPGNSLDPHIEPKAVNTKGSNPNSFPHKKLLGVGREIEHLIQLGALKHFMAKKYEEKVKEERESKERDASGAKPRRT
ncbi:conserved hypothetical protein [Ricinus communis]|uniref:Uncharacterized protein n=1 Tax=Ricinus communis TaxID=3988 RepID=B9S2Z5_RICCO|nr:conserved hypothetical protein [Ricinus communis]